MADSTNLNLEFEILARVIAGSPTLSSNAAREILGWSFSESDRERMAELTAKARAGTLSSGEHVEIEGYERVSSFLGFVKSKARRSLQNLRA